MFSFSEAPAPKQKDVFMWVGFRKLHSHDPQTLENILLFARRFGIIPYASGMNDPKDLENFLQTCRKLKIPRTWIEISPGKSVTLREFSDNPSAREPILGRFRTIAQVYRKHYPDFARITIFDEAPLGAFKISRESRGFVRRTADFRKYGPKAYTLLQSALKQEFPEAEVGIFLHHPLNASPRMSGRFSIIEEFMQGCRDLEADPDFIFSDVYRGYFDRGYGWEPANDYIKDVISYTKKTADTFGARAYYLGQMHTIKLGYTPSRQNIDSNIQAALQAGADGMGWYWPNYAATGFLRTPEAGAPGKNEGYPVSFRSFVPNSWGRIGPAGSVYGTSKDRFAYAYLKLLEETGKIRPQECFDLWLYGFDFDHTEHQVYLRRFSGKIPEWERIGIINPQQDRNGYHPELPVNHSYSGNSRWKAVCFRALSRKSFLIPVSGGDFRMDIRITTEEGDESKLAAVYALPYPSADHFEEEGEMETFIRDNPRWIKVESLSHSVFPISRNLFPGQDFYGRTGPDSLLFRGDFWSEQAFQDILPYWTEYAPHPKGGFYSILDRAWNPGESGLKHPGMISRHLFSYSAAYLLTGEKKYIKTASRIKEFLIRNGWDERYGGWYSALDQDNNPADTRKDGFYQTYAAAGLALYHFVTHDRTADEYIQKTLDLWQRYAWDPDNQGYFRRFTRDWKPLNTHKTCSNQLAPLSGPLIYWYLTDPGQDKLSRMEQLLNIIFDRMQDPETGWIRERFDSEWNPLPTGEKKPEFNVGHNQETAWMAARLYRLTGKEIYLRNAEYLWDRLFRFCRDPETGAWFHKCSLSNPENHSQGVPWWIQAYGNMLSLYMYSQNQDPRALKAYILGALFWNRYFIDRESGAVYLSVNHDGSILKGDKAVRTKTSYHSLEQALLNHLYLKLWFSREPVTLYFFINQPRSRKLFPLPVENPNVKISRVFINGRSWSDILSEPSAVRLPETGPAEIQVILDPGDLNPGNVRFIYPPPSGNGDSFDLWITGKKLNSGRHRVYLKSNPGEGSGWEEAASWGPDEASGDVRTSRTGVVIPGLSLKKFYGGDIRENSLAVKITASENSSSAEIKTLSAVPPLSIFPDKPGLIKDFLNTHIDLVRNLQWAGLIRPRHRKLSAGIEYIEHLPAPVRHRKPGIMESLWLELIFKNR